MRYTLTLPKQRQHRYWLVDTASLPEGEVLRHFYATTKQPMFRWLYDGTPYQAVRESGPVLLDITQDASAWRQFSAEWVGKAASVVVDTAEPLDELQQRLAASLTIQTSGNGIGLLRFHEPALLHLLLGEGLLSPANRRILAGEATCWFWPLCQSQGNIIHECYFSPGSTSVGSDRTLKIDTVIQQRLFGLRQFSRLMPLLGDAIYRFNLLQREEQITSLWRELEQYWNATWQSNLPRKKAVENAQNMLVRSNELEQFIEALS